MTYTDKESFKLEKQPMPGLVTCHECLGYGRVTSRLFDTPGVKDITFDCNACQGWGWRRVKPA